MAYIAYIRVSTNKQSLGLDAQRRTIKGFVSSSSGSVIAEYVERVSGAKDNREEMGKALAHCKRTGATLLVAKLDRLSRRVSFVANLLESKISIKVAEMPQADLFQLHIYAALAEQERTLISRRTKEALAARKAQGVQLGAYSKVLARENRERKEAFVSGILPTIETLQKEGVTSLYGIAKRLNEMKVPTANGGKWYPTTVSNYIKVD